MSTFFCILFCNIDYTHDVILVLFILFTLLHRYLCCASFEAVHSYIQLRIMSSDGLDVAGVCFECFSNILYVKMLVLVLLSHEYCSLY